MRKFLLFILTLFLFIPINVYADSYKLKDLEISIEDSSFDVFTRDNIKDNERLTEIGITYDYLNNFMIKNDVYLDAVKFNENNDDTIELFVVAKMVSNVSNMHTYSDNEIKELGEEVKKKVKADSYKIINVGKYKYIYLNYYDSTEKYYIDEYYTVMDGYGYTIMAQKRNKFTNDEMKDVKKVVDTTKYKEIARYEKKKSSSIGSRTLIGAIVGAVIGLIGGTIKVIKNKKTKEKSE